MKAVFSVALLALAVAADDKCMTAEELVKANWGSDLCKTDVEVFGELRHEICSGLPLEAPGVADLFWSMGLDYDAVWHGKKCLAQKDCDWIMNNEIEQYRTVSWKFFTSPCACANAVLTDMTYSMRAQLDTKDFETFINHVQHNHYSDAADELKKTLWCREIGEDRCQRDADQIKNFCTDAAPDFLQ